MPWWKWSQSAASNATADPNIAWPEGMAPSAVNDSARAMMAETAKYRDDISGALVTAGSSTAYTVTSNSGFDTLAHLHGQVIAFTPHATSTNTVGADVTLSVDGLAAKPVRAQQNIPLPGGALVLGTPYLVLYNNTDGAFYLHGMVNPYVVPLGSGMDYWGATAPNSCFAFPIGQAISRTTFAPLFALFGTTYGVGDGSTTFNLPDRRGRISVPPDNMGGTSSNRINNVLNVALGSVGGQQQVALATLNLPPYTPAGSVSVSGSVTIDAAQGFQTGGSFTGLVKPGSGNTSSAVDSISATGSFTGTPQGGTSTPFATVPPAITCNYILRII